MTLSDLCKELFSEAAHPQKAAAEACSEGPARTGQSSAETKSSTLLHASLVRSVLDSLTEGVVIADAQGRLLFLNPSAERMVGLGVLPNADPEEWPERYGLYIPGTDTLYPSRDLPLARALRGESVTEEEVVIKNKKRPQEVWVSVNANPLKDADGKLLGAVCAFRDVTHHKQSQNETLKIQALMHSIVENLPAMVFVKDAKELRFALFNKAGEELLGHPRQTMLGKNDYDFFPKDQADFFTSKDREVLEKKRLVDIPEEPIHTKDKGLRILRTKKIPLLDSRGRPSYLLGISEDITEHKRREEALRKKSLELNSSIAEKEQLELFTQLTSHDLQAPLQKIIGFSELLEEHIAPALDERGRHFLDKVKEGARRMCLLMDGLVDFATVVSRRESFEEVDLNEIVRGVLLDLEMRIMQSKARVTLDEPLPTIQADKTQIRELVYNLVSNAIKFHPKDHAPRVRIRAKSWEDGRVTFTVADNGVGFDMKQKSRIFKPFERLCRREDYEGMGIGLAICQKIVLRHNGHIQVRSAPDRGTAFKVTLSSKEPD